MTYRGDDLDLRTPQGLGSSWRDSLPSSLAEAPMANGSGLRSGLGSAGLTGSARDPIFVDETLLGCCNDAYDLALVHRSGEVRLVHLLHAMTQSDQASLVLEARGVGVVSLRSETGQMMSLEPPVGLSNGKAAPRKSPELEDVLRLAGTRALTRRAPADIDDVVSVLLEASHEGLSMQMLRRHTTIARPLREAPEPRERVRAQTRSYGLSERLTREQPEDLPGRRPGDYLNADLRRDASSSRDDSMMSAHVVDRLSQLERGIEYKFTDIERAWSTLTDRLGGLEKSVQNSRADNLALPNALSDQLRGLQGVEDKLVSLERTFSGLTERLMTLERQVERRALGSADGINLDPLLARISSLERSVTGGMGEGARNWSALGERLKALEKAVVTRSSDGLPIDMGPVHDKLGQIEARGAETMRFSAAFADRLSAIEGKLADPQRTNAALAERLKHLDETMAAQRGEVRALRDQITQAQSEQQRLPQMMAERLAGLTSLMERQRSEVAGSIAQPLLEKVASFTALVDQRGNDTARAGAQITERLAQIEKGMQGFGQRSLEVTAQHDRDLEDVHEALIKLNTNQQTLASSFDQWRGESAGDISVIANRLDEIERATRGPMALLETTNHNVQRLIRFNVERAERRSRFKHWLFGTQDWYSASWDTQNWQRQQQQLQADILAGRDTPSSNVMPGPGQATVSIRTPGDRVQPPAAVAGPGQGPGPTAVPTMPTIVSRRPG